MGTPNTSPIFSRQGDFNGSAVLTTAAADYLGQNINNQVVFASDTTNGSFVQRLRFKALGTNVATVARIYINNGGSRFAAAVAAVSGTPTGTPSPTGGTLYAGNFFAKIYAVDQYGSVTVASTETAAVAVTGTTGSITWNWTAVTGAVSYIITVGLATGAQQTSFNSTTNSYVQTTAGTTPLESGVSNNNYFYGEVSLPATTAAANTATVEIDYPMNFAMKPGHNIVVGLGTTVAAGWVISTIAGTY